MSESRKMIFRVSILTVLLLSVQCLYVSKLSSQVWQGWVARYSGPDDYSDKAKAMAFDRTGNVCVTGWSTSDDSEEDYTTIKYDIGGNELWIATYDGPNNTIDLADDIAVDNDDMIIVTGYSYGSGTYGDCTTIKYDASGNELWVVRYNGPGNSDDRGSAVVVDGEGNIYVTGETWISESSYNFLTLKYTPDGTELWAVEYNGPGNSWDRAWDIEVDDSGFVYVTGVSIGSGTDQDFATVKYDSEGIEQWVVRYDGLGNNWDNPSGLTLDDEGNVYVTGLSDGVGTDEDYCTIKYDNNGNELWVSRYDGPAHREDDPTAIALDEEGNVYVTGGSWGLGTGLDCTTVKYDSQGNEMWVRRYHGRHLHDSALDICIDGEENVYVTGYSFQIGYQDFLTIKYDSTGNELWIAEYDGPSGLYDVANAILVDQMGYVYITGESFNTEGTNCDYATVRYGQGTPRHRIPTDGR